MYYLFIKIFVYCIIIVQIANKVGCKKINNLYTSHPVTLWDNGFCEAVGMASVDTLCCILRQAFAVLPSLAYPKQDYYHPAPLLGCFLFFFYLVGWDLTPLGPFAGPLGSYKPQYCGHTLAYCTFSPDDT
jgi:hypothetical protein